MNIDHADPFVTQSRNQALGKVRVLRWFSPKLCLHCSKIKLTVEVIIHLSQGRRTSRGGRAGTTGAVIAVIHIVICRVPFTRLHLPRHC